MLAVTPPSPIVRVPRDVEGWVRCFDPTALPVLSGTAQMLEELRPNEDQVDAHFLAETISADPLLTLKVLLNCSLPAFPPLNRHSVAISMEPEGSRRGRLEPSDVLA